MQKLQLKVLPNQYSIHKLKERNGLPSFFEKNISFYSFTVTEEETSLICDSNIKIESSDKDENWSCLKLVGQLNLEETGIWSKITTICSDSGFAVLAITTFDTDYFLVKTQNLGQLRKNFLENNFIFID